MEKTIPYIQNRRRSHHKKSVRKHLLFCELDAIQIYWRASTSFANYFALLLRKILGL